MTPSLLRPDGPVTLALVGAGQRGSVYASWIAEHPERARVVAVAEPRQHQRDAIVAAHKIPPEMVFESWKELAAAGRVADAAVVTTQDHHHVEPAVALAEAGYHLMLEKPMAPTEEGCRTIIDAVTRAGVMFAVCHVMRYTPYTRAFKQAVDSGWIGDVVSIQHLEPVGFWHQAHSYVRGNWRREDTSSFMLMTKSCHDLDWLRYIVGRPATRVSSFGGLAHFRPEQAPVGSADRCLECAVEAECPYSAPRLYRGLLAEGRLGWPLSVITDDLTEDGVEQALRDGPYGRCVYQCDNDVVDHQVVAMEFDGGVTATFTMTAFSEAAHRRTQVFGTRGRIDGDGEQISVLDFVTGRTEVLDVTSAGSDTASGHGGGDAGLVDAFVTALATGNPGAIRSGPAETLETHLTVFAAERARRAGTVEEITAEALAGSP